MCLLFALPAGSTNAHMLKSCDLSDDQISQALGEVLSNLPAVRLLGLFISIMVLHDRTA